MAVNELIYRYVYLFSFVSLNHRMESAFGNGKIDAAKDA